MSGAVLAAPDRIFQLRKLLFQIVICLFILRDLVFERFQLRLAAFDLLFCLRSGFFKLFLSLFVLFPSLFQRFLSVLIFLPGFIQLLLLGIQRILRLCDLLPAVLDLFLCIRQLLFAVSDLFSRFAQLFLRLFFSVGKLLLRIGDLLLGILHDLRFPDHAAFLRAVFHPGLHRRDLIIIGVRKCCERFCPFHLKINFCKCVELKSIRRHYHKGIYTSCSDGGAAPSKRDVGCSVTPAHHRQRIRAQRIRYRIFGPGRHHDLIADLIV